MSDPALAPLTLADPRFRRVERLATAMRQPLQLASVKPEPPRGVHFNNGIATWEEPHETRNVTHYVIYADDENHVERRVPVGQVKATSVAAVDRIFVSSFNDISELESNAVVADDEFVEPVLGPPGEEYIPVTGGGPGGGAFTFTATQTADLGEAGIQVFRISGTVGPSGSALYGGARIVAKVNGRPGIIWVADLTEDQTQYESPLYPKTGATDTWNVYALLRDIEENHNSLVDPGTTPKVILTISPTAGTLNLGRAISTSYDNTELEILSGVFRITNTNLFKASHYNTTHFEIALGVFAIKQVPASLLTGNLFGVTYSLTLNGVETTIDNSTSGLGGFTTAAGLRVRRTTTSRDTIIGDGTVLVRFDGVNVGAWLTADNTGNGGLLRLYTTGGANTVSLIGQSGAVSTTGNVNAASYSAAGIPGIDAIFEPFISAVSFSLVNLQYKDHAGVNQTQQVVSSFGATTTTHNFSKGLLTS